LAERELSPQVAIEDCGSSGPASLVAVFDGHGRRGEDVSAAVAARMRANAALLCARLVL
jgi:hypothetical protein